MMSERQIHSFHWVDFLVFGLMLIISTAIGLFYTCHNRRNQTVSNFLKGDRDMNAIVVALSIMASNVSAILILGVPAEIYTFGGTIWLETLAGSVGAILAAVVFVPLLFPLQLTSTNEYLQLRFKSSLLRYMGLIFSVELMVGYTAVVLYSPSTAVEAVTGFPTWASILICGGVSTFYTTLGGLKGVVWTDAFQSFVMVVGMLGILIQGAIKTGGFGVAWNIAKYDGRLDVLKLDPDPRARMTLWTCVVGSGLSWMGYLGMQQPALQRYTSLKSLAIAQRSLLVVLPGHLIMITLALASGVVVYAYYAMHGCDPLADGQVSNPNQLIPLFVMETLYYRGVPGLFFACICAGSLSTASSCLNSAAANIWADFVKYWIPNAKERTAVIINMTIVFSVGLIATIFAFGMLQFGGNLIQVVTGCGIAPHMGLFLLGSIIPWANWIGAFVGALSGMGLVLWINLGAFMVGKHLEFLPTRTQTCGLSDELKNLTNWNTSISTIDTAHSAASNLYGGWPSNGSLVLGKPNYSSGLPGLYSISFMWMASAGAATTLIVGAVVSTLTMKWVKQHKVDCRLLLPLMRRLHVYGGLDTSYQDPDIDDMHLDKETKLVFRVSDEVRSEDTLLQQEMVELKSRKEFRIISQRRQQAQNIDENSEETLHLFEK